MRYAPHPVHFNGQDLPETDALGRPLTWAAKLRAWDQRHHALMGITIANSPRQQILTHKQAMCSCGWKSGMTLSAKKAEEWHSRHRRSQ